MPMPSRSIHRRPGAIRWQVLAFLLAFVLLLVAVLVYCLVPGMQAAQHATETEKQHLVAWFRLLLAVLLLILFCGLLLTFRVSRFFLPRPDPPKTRTKYVDAWAEAGRRAQAPEEEEDDQENVN
jgi:cytochrome c biogenesis protein CcdA